MLLKIGGGADLTGAPQVQPRRSPPAPRPPVLAEPTPAARAPSFGASRPKAPSGPGSAADPAALRSEFTPLKRGYKK